jgi:AcrR family transcriptional regulator
MPRVSDKRIRLVNAAKTLFHEQGFAQTSLADVADKSEVPLGNVYYYFKSKEDLASAVIQAHQNDIVSLLNMIDGNNDNPYTRITDFLTAIKKSADNISRRGCPVGSLCQELGKDVSHLSQATENIILIELNWLTKQFHAMGHKDARYQAQYVISVLQGASLLANTLKEKRIFINQINGLENWLRNFT